jgi:UDP-GlcNAc:undecaprenyl-phosphate GlcNAc-1-phosphate transferase
MSAIKDIIKDYIVVSLLAFMISVILTPIIRRSCRKKQVLDFPTDPRKIHANPVPRLGGIAIYFAFFLPLFAIFLTDEAVYEIFSKHFDTLLSLYMTSTLVFAIGVYDDIKGATVLQKLFVQAIAAIAIYFLGFKIHLIAVPFIGPVSLGIWGLPVTILWIVGVTNALNFIDGVDGLACGVGFFSVSTMFILSLFLHNSITAFFAAALAGGLFGFALYNFAPASIFMGDSGSLFIGFIIAAISLYGSQKSSTVVVLLLPIVVLGVPIADTLLAIIRRLANGRSPFTADKEHIHHRLLRMGLSSRQVVLALYGVCSFLGITALLMTAVNNQMLTLILIILSVMTIGGMKILGYTADVIAINRLAKERIHQKKLLLERQRWAEQILDEIRMSSDVFTLQKTIIKYFENMEFDVGTVKSSMCCIQDDAPSVTNRIVEPFEFTWYSLRYEQQEIPTDQIWTITVPLVFNEKKYGEFLAGKYIASNISFFENTIIVENLKNAIEQSLNIRK